MAEPWSENLPVGTPLDSPFHWLEMPKWIEDILTSDGSLPWNIALEKEVGISKPTTILDRAKEAITNTPAVVKAIGKDVQKPTAKWLTDAEEWVNSWGNNILIYVALFLILLGAIVILLLPPKEEMEKDTRMAILAE